MRERPNRTVSKTVVSIGHRGFKSHSLRRRTWPGLPAVVAQATARYDGWLLTRSLTECKVNWTPL